MTLTALAMSLYRVNSGYFHAYDSQKEVALDESCKDFKDHYSSTEEFGNAVKKYKLWPDLVSPDHTFTPNSTIYGMKYALDAIWKHQHPSDCSKVKFLINGFHNGGFGSELHVLGGVFGLGMELDRVVLQNPIVHSAVTWETDNSFCQGQGKRFLECYYEPWSSCTIHDALGPDAMQILRGVPAGSTSHKHPKLVAFPVPTDYVDKLQEQSFRENFVKQHADKKTIMIKVPGWLKFGVVPHQFRQLLECSPMMPMFRYYWWRAISTAYIVRPNNNTIAWLNDHRLTALDSHERFVSLYIRRGDKSIEAKLPPTNEFIHALGMLYDRNMIDFEVASQDSNSKKILFLASEDSKVISNMKEWAARHKRYELHLTEVFDRKGLLAERSHEDRLKGRNANKPDHHPEEYLSMLLNVHYLVRASAYICTLSSNFCRVIDELRATAAAKADKPFVDLSEETCGRPPCVYGNLTFLDWRR